MICAWRSRAAPVRARASPAPQSLEVYAAQAPAPLRERATDRPIGCRRRDDRMLILLGVAVVVVGFALRFNPLLVVVAAALTSGWFAGLSPLQVIAAFGKAYNENRYV